MARIPFPTHIHLLEKVLSYFFPPLYATLIFLYCGELSTPLHCRKSRPIFRDIRGSVDDLYLYGRKCSKVNCSRYISEYSEVLSRYRKKGYYCNLIHRPPVSDASTLATRPTKQGNIYEIEQYWISKQFLRWTSEYFVIYHEISKFGKIQINSGKTSTHRAENIFPKYLLCMFMK